MKKFLVGLSLFLVSFMNFGFVFAGTDTLTDVQKKQAQDIKNLQLFAQGLYTAVWPMLTLAGAFMSNSVVYGSFLGMDVMLWKLWNVMRVFANYIIGFLLIFSIFSLFLGGKFEKFNPTKLLPQIAVAAVLVNMSWFLIGVCIDISNILTYAVGKLPIHAEKNVNNSKDEVPFVKPAIKFQSSKNDALVLGVADDKNNIIPFCSLTTSGKYYIVKSAFQGNNKSKKNKNLYCAFLYNGKFYKVEVGKKVKSIKDIAKTEIKSDKNAPKGTGLMGPLFSIYGSFLNIASLVTFHSGNATSEYMELFMKLIFLVAFMIPLIALVIILVVRVVLIWMYIVFSPFIFLFTPLKDIGGKLLGEKGKLSNMCCMIFLPVFVVFAMSLAFAFIKSINFEKESKNGGTTFMKKLGIYTGENSVILKVTSDDKYNIKIKVDTNGADNAFLNNFGTLDTFLLILIKWIFGIAFTWILVFTALKSCKLTEKIASSIQTFSEGMLKSTPFIPVPGAGRQSIASLKQGIYTLKQLPSGWQQNQFDEKIKPWLDEMQRRTSGVEERNIKAASQSAQTLETSVKKTVTHNIGTTQAYLNSDKGEDLNLKVGKILGDSKKLSTVASKLGISTDWLKDILDKQKHDAKLSEILNSNSVKEAITKEILKEELKKFIKGNVLDKNITLLQLTDDAKDKLKALIAEAFGKDVEIKEFDDCVKDSSGKCQELIKILKCELKFDNAEIVKLLQENLIGSKTEESLKKLEKKLDSIDCGKKKK